MKSNAPCLYRDERGEKCYNTVTSRGSYCKLHERPAFFNNNSRALPKNWENIRKTVLRRDKGICYICKGGGADSVDHIIPRSQGGTDSLSNLRAAHQDIPPYCHKDKTQEESQYGKSNMARTPKFMKDLPDYLGDL